MINSYIAVDLETTGLHSKEDRIIEIAALRVEDGQIKDRFSTLVDPGRDLEERIMELTGITDKMLTGAPKIEDVIREAVDFCEGLPVLGHHVIFDYSFLKQSAVNAGLSFEHEGIDTLALCRRFMPTDAKHTLGAACEYYNISQSRAHRAEADAEASHLLYQKLAGLYGAENPQDFVSKPLVYKAKRSQPATKRQKEYLQDLLKCHRINVTVRIDSLSRSEASRLIDKIISQNGKLKQV